MDFSTIFTEIVKVGGVWGALLLLSGAANVYLFKQFSALYEKTSNDRIAEVKEMTSALEKFSATLVAITSSVSETAKTQTSQKNVMDEMNRAAAVSFSELKILVQQNKEAIKEAADRYDRRNGGVRNDA